MRKLICRLFGHKYTITAYLNGLPALETCKRCHVDRIVGPGGVKILQQRKNKSGSDALRWPLFVKIFKFEGYYIAEEHEFSLWSDGATIQEALDGIQAFFLHEYQRYVDTPNEMMDLIARQEKRKYADWVKAYGTSMTRRQTVTDRYAYMLGSCRHPKIYVAEDLTE